jgi:hypothetical protein
LSHFKWNIGILKDLLKETEGFLQRLGPSYKWIACLPSIKPLLPEALMERIMVATAFWGLGLWFLRSIPAAESD